MYGIHVVQWFPGHGWYFGHWRQLTTNLCTFPIAQIARFPDQQAPFVSPLSLNVCTRGGFETHHNLASLRKMYEHSAASLRLTKAGSNKFNSYTFLYKIYSFPPFVKTNARGWHIQDTLLTGMHTIVCMPRSFRNFPSDVFGETLCQGGRWTKSVVDRTTVHLDQSHPKSKR